jgi:Archaea bacterial proteins of unknown function
MYRVADQHLSFWHRFVAPLRATVAIELREPSHLCLDVIAPKLNEHLGPVFESACRSLVGFCDHQRLPFRPVRVGEWRADDSSEQVDVVTIGADGDILIGECKWSSVGRVDPGKLSARRDPVVEDLRGVARVHLALFSGALVGDAALSERIAVGDVLHFSLDDLHRRSCPATCLPIGPRSAHGRWGNAVICCWRNQIRHSIVSRWE